MENRLPCRYGFTLIELSIVLVIIGLIIGGVLVGQDLIKAAGNRAFISQLEKYNAAVNTFRTKYNCLPGDCPNGTAFGFLRNGDGNGYVTSITIDGGTTFVDGGNPTPTKNPIFVSFAPADTPGTAIEGTLFWQELQTAGLISGLSQIGVDAGGYPMQFPVMANSHEWLVLGAWSGKHYYHTGMDTVIGGYIIDSCSYIFSPADALYLTTKYGQNAFTTTSTAGSGAPDAVAKGEQIIPVSTDPGCGVEARYYWTPTMGSGGASSDVCLSTDSTPPSLNVASGKKLCNLMIRADF